MHQHTITQCVPLSLGDAWAFFSDPRNLAVITPPAMGFHIRSDVPEVMHPGLIIAYTVKPIFGIPLGWVTEITHVADREYFVDEQRAGPYQMWHHEHHFREVPGGVEMRDIVSYALPFGPLGDLVNRLVVGARVREIFRYREQVLEERFGRFDGARVFQAGGFAA